MSIDQINLKNCLMLAQANIELAQAIQLAQANIGQLQTDLQGRLFQIYQNSSPTHPTSCLPQPSQGSTRTWTADSFSQQPMPAQQKARLSSKDSGKRKTASCATRLTHPGQLGSRQPGASPNITPVTKRLKTSSNGIQPPPDQNFLQQHAPISATAAFQSQGVSFNQNLSGVETTRKGWDRNLRLALVNIVNENKAKGFSLQKCLELARQDPRFTDRTTKALRSQYDLLMPNMSKVKKTWTTEQEKALVEFVDANKAQGITIEKSVEHLSERDPLFAKKSLKALKIRYGLLVSGAPSPLCTGKKKRGWTSDLKQDFLKKVAKARAQGATLTAIFKRLSAEDPMFQDRTPEGLKIRYRLLNKGKCKTNKKSEP